MRTSDKRWAFWDREEIVLDGEPYISRLRLLATPFFGVYTHYIHKPDNTELFHDHPWSFLTFVLSGGYNEVVYYDHDAHERVLRRFSLAYLPIFKAHRIDVVLRGTRTLVFHGPRRKGWGFIEPLSDIAEMRYTRDVGREKD